MNKKSFLIIITLFMILIISTLMTAFDNKEFKILSNNISSDIDKEYRKKIKTSGVLFKKDKSSEIMYIFEEDNGKSFIVKNDIALNEDESNNKNNLENYINYHVNIIGRYKIIYRKNIDNEIIQNYNLIIDSIDIKYHELDIVGNLSLRGSPPKLILTTEEQDISYEIDRSQEMYEILITDYQGYKVHITGKYYSLIYYRKDSKIERRYIIIDKIEIL